MISAAEARYWSICHTGGGPDGKYNGLVYGCLLDEDVVTDQENDYILVYGQGTPPANARPECGVTWQDIGPESMQGLVLRWMSVFPEHQMQDYAPNDDNLPWETTGWYSADYDIDLVGRNTPDAMGPYHPLIHHLSRAAFEALGCPVSKDSLPLWE